MDVSHRRAIPAALKQHQCPLVVNAELAQAVGILRGWRLVVAAMREDDDDASGSILDEVEGCVLCLRLMVSFLSSTAASLTVGVAGDNQDLAVAQAEKMLREYTETARKQL